MTPHLVSSYVEHISGGRKEPLNAPANAVMEFKVDSQFRGAQAGELNLVLFNTTYAIGAPSISNPANFELTVIHVSSFKTDSPLTEEIASDASFRSQMINIAGALSQAKVSSLLSDFGFNADVPISRPAETPNALPRQPTKQPTKRRLTKS